MSLGRLEGCYWVAQGRFLAGAYPQGANTIARLRELGVTLFVDLTRHGEYGLVPYDALLPDGMRAIRRPVRDFGIPRPQEMRGILDLIDAELAAGGVVYVHCYRGVGRTGTVVGCHLVRHGTPPEHAVEAIARLRAEVRQERRPSPETEEQCRLVESWRD